MSSGSGGDCPKATGSRAIRCKLNVCVVKLGVKLQIIVSRSETYHISSRVLLGENSTGLVGGDLEVGDDGHGLDLLGPGELDVVTDSMRRVRGRLASVLTTGWRRKNLAEGDFCPRDVLGGQGLEVSSDEPTIQSSSDIVRMSLYNLC